MALNWQDAGDTECWQKVYCMLARQVLIWKPESKKNDFKKLKMNEQILQKRF